LCIFLLFIFFFTATATSDIYTLSLHDALPICWCSSSVKSDRGSENKKSLLSRPMREGVRAPDAWHDFKNDRFQQENQMGRKRKRSEEHTSELQSRFDLVCRLLLEKKKIKK